MELIKAREEHFEGIYPLLQQFQGRVRSQEDWRALFKNHWDPPQEHYGYLLKDDDQIIGFLGLIYSRRSFVSKDIWFANITSWVVEEKYRGKSLMLLAPVVKSEELTITCFTPSRESLAVFKKLGFTVCDEYLIFIPGMPFFNFLPTDFEIEFDHKEIEKLLSKEELKIFHDHKFFTSLHFIVKSKGSYCYVVAQRAIKRKLPFLVVHYLSNPHVFVRVINRFSLGLCFRKKVVGLLVYEHCLKGCRVWPAVKIRLRFPTMFRSKQLSREHIDTLYSEFFLLNFA